MEDTKKILQKFYVTLRNNVNATAVYREVLGLSQFDRELIIAQRTNTEAVDKLVDIVGSRSTRSFVSFVDALKKHDHIEIVDNILLVAKQNYPQIHRVLVTPTATVPPSSNTHSCPCVVNQASQNTPNGRNNQNYIRHGQNEAAATQDTEESDSENESSILTLDTKLTQIAYEDVMQWVEELNKSKQWKKLATKMKLNYQTVKDLEKEEEPVDAFFHQHCSNLTIKRFLNYLTKAGLTSVLAMVRNRIDERYDSSGFQQTSLQEEGNNAPDPAELSYDTHAIVQPMNFLNRDDSIIDNTQISSNDNKPSSPLISKRTNIGSVSNNDTSFNIGNVDNLTMIYTIQGDTKSSLSDKDGSMKPAEIEKNKLVDDEEVVNQRKTQQRFGNEFPDTENMQSRDQSPPLQELNTKKDPILAKPENIKEKYNDQWCEKLLDEGGMNETLEDNLSSSIPTNSVAQHLLHTQPESIGEKTKKHPAEQDCNDMLTDAGMARRSEHTCRNIHGSIPDADSVVE